jgi:uncharacterized protein YkwD
MKIARKNTPLSQKLITLIGLGCMFGLFFSGCVDGRMVIPVMDREIEVLPKAYQAAAVEVVWVPSLTPFQPLAAGADVQLFTAVAAEQLRLDTLTTTPAAQSSLLPTTLLTEEITTLTAAPTETITMTITGTQQRFPTATTVFSPSPGMPMLTGTAAATRTQTRTAVPVMNTYTQTQTRTLIPNTAVFTSQPQNTATATPLPATRTFTSEPVGCAYTENGGYESTLINLINEERVAQGLPAYGINGQLTRAARGHSQDMACNGYFSHTGLDGSTAASRVAAQGYSYSWVGENIFAGSGGYNSPQSAFSYWMQSPAHYANLMHTNYTEIGIGYIHNPGSMYGGYFTANFARP